MSNKGQRILFVDDEPRVLRGLRRSLEELSDTWDMTFVHSGAEALECMAEQAYDVIVSDMRMPGMDGVELLNQVRALYPSTIRIALSGQSAKESVLQCIGPIHQYLPKPCDLATLQSTLTRSWALRELLAVEKLQGLLSRAENLPSLPSLFHRLMKEFKSPDGSIREVGRIVSEDQAMSAKVLQLVNSAFFGMTRCVSCPAEAVASIGMENLQALALTVCVFSPLENSALEAFAMEDLWKHSVEVGSLSREIARWEDADDQIVEDAFLAGLLHDIGKLALASMIPEEYAEVVTCCRNEDIGVDEVERRVIGATHAEVGAYLLGLWGFSDTVMQVLAYHHRPQEAGTTGFTALTAVHVANVLKRDLDRLKSAHSRNPVDEDYLKQNGLGERFEEWLNRSRDVAEVTTS